jgi:hypothetical protein
LSDPVVESLAQCFSRSSSEVKVCICCKRVFFFSNEENVLY